jgi:Skp family chaperone for outer membrane proteins
VWRGIFAIGVLVNKLHAVAVTVAACVGAAFVAAKFGVHVLTAQRELPFRIAIVDGTRITNESKVFLRITELEKQSFDEINEEFAEKYKHLQQLLKKSRNPDNSAQARQNYKKQFDNEFAILDPQVQKKKDERKRQVTTVINRLNEAVAAVTNVLAQKYKLDLILNTHVFDKMTVFYASPSIDLTSEAIVLLDKQIHELTEGFK